jgi:hypothetical protein
MSETPATGTAHGAPASAQGAGPEEIGPTPTRTPAHAAPRPEGGAEPTAWVGWIMFGSVLLMMLGTFQAIVGLTALVRSDYYVVAEERLLVNVDFSAWGWVHLALAALAWATAFGLLAGKMWARVVGIGIASLSALVNMAFVEAYPLWSMTMIALDVVVIYAIAVHGAELENRRA